MIDAASEVVFFLHQSRAVTFRCQMLMFVFGLTVSLHLLFFRITLRSSTSGCRKR